MSSLDKSQVIDYYREYPDSCVCTIGKYQNDYDAIMTSNVGINLSSKKIKIQYYATFILVIPIYYLSKK